jgi:hypothetical protein
MEDEPLPISATEFLDRKREQRVQETRKTAHRKWGMSIMRQSMGDVTAEQHARDALRLAASAFWIAEDSPLEDAAHEDLDKFGRWTRETFGCALSFEDGHYVQKCPVAIAHKRVGLSVGMLVTNRICAICGQKFPDSCTHRSGVVYQVNGGPNQLGFCKVCGSRDCAKHVAGQIYPTVQTRIVLEAELVEYSLVRRPAQPEARPTKLPVSWDEIRRSYPGTQRGDRVSCDRCLYPCSGIQEVLKELEWLACPKRS